jgi:hypothetical protein
MDETTQNPGALSGDEKQLTGGAQSSPSLAANQPPAPPPSGGSPASAGAGSPPTLDNAPVNARPPAPVLTPTPMVKPHRSGLAGVVDGLLDDLAGTKGQPKLTQGNDGNYYVETPALSRKGQWLKITSEAIHGASAGAQQMHGPGGAERGFAAGVDAGDKMAEQQGNQGQELTQEARQANQDRFNQIKLQHDKAMWAFEEAHAQHQGTEDEIKLNNDEMTREIKPPEQGGLGSQDLGVHANLSDLATQMSKTNPEFWKHVYGDTQGSGVVGYKEYDPSGKVTGIHFFARTPGVNGQAVDEDQAFFKVFKPGKTAQDAPTLEQQKATVPMTVGQQSAYNAAADNQMSQWQETQRKAQREADEHQKALDEHAAAPGQRAHVAAETAHVNTETRQLNEATTQDAVKNNAQQMVEGTIDPSNLSKRSKSYDATLAAANSYSMQKYGKPFDLAAAASDYKYSTNAQTQNTLKMIRGMADPGGSIEIAQNAAKALPQLPEATLNKVFNAAATEFGSKEATNFHTAMLGLADEYSKVMGGGTATDSGRKQALDLLKASYSKGQLGGAIDTMRQDISARQKALVGTNRYLLRQYAPARPQNVPPNYVHRDGPNGIGWYAP